MRNQCLYLVSSSSTREYVLDCVEALAVPRGIVHHFRYNKKYIDERLRAVLPASPGRLPKSLRDIPVLVVYLYQEQTSGAWKPAKTLNDEGAYVPLRYGRLIDAFFEGDIAHFYFEANDYVAPMRRKRTARELLNQSVSFRVSAKKDARESYAHWAGHVALAASRASDAVAFQRFVYEAYKPGEWRTRSLGRAPLDVSYDVVFVRIGGMFREQGDRLVPINPRPRLLIGNPWAEYELAVDATYHLQVATLMAARLPAELPGRGRASLRLRFDPAVIGPAGPTSFHLSSTYDLHYWSFRVKKKAPQRTLLTVACDHDSVTDTDYFLRRELLCPEITLPVSTVAASSGIAHATGGRSHE